MKWVSFCHDQNYFLSYNSIQDSDQLKLRAVICYTRNYIVFPQG